MLGLLRISKGGRGGPSQRAKLSTGTYVFRSQGPPCRQIGCSRKHTPDSIRGPHQRRSPLDETTG